MGTTIIDEEQRHLSEVRTFLEQHPYDLPPSESDIVAELVRLREEIPSAKAEDKGSLMEQYNHNYALLEQVREARDRADVDPDSPYFAHMGLREPQGDRHVFLGKATRIDKGIRIVDWRNAPISRLFYAYQQGEEYEEPLGGKTHTGEVIARRTLTIRRGQLDRIDAPEGTFTYDDGEWTHTRPQPPRMAGGQGTAFRTHQGDGSRRRLGTDMSGARRRADKHLPDIAGLIDPEQFELITRPSSGYVVIRGAAGSGKTTVALHRVAYLAYSDPAINTPRTLFIVFSRGLREYVSNVLPALGVPRAQVRDFPTWVRKLRAQHFPFLPRTPRDDTPALLTRAKTHPGMLGALRSQVERVNGPTTPEQAFDDVVSALTDVSLLSEHTGDDFTPLERERIATQCRDQFERVVDWMGGDRDNDAALDAEDDALLLRAWQLRVGPLRFRKQQKLRYRHVAIDEVQDFSPLEVRILIDCLDQRKSLTLAGDTQQHVMKEAGFTSWTDFFSRLGLAGTEVNTLQIAYRSSSQIVDFSIKVLGELAEDDTPPTTVRDGPAVELFRFTDHGACVAFLADALKQLMDDEPLASIALLTPDASTSSLYERGMLKSEVPRVRRIVDQNFTFTAGVDITEVPAVKGLEFDYIVVVQATAQHYPITDANRRLLHVASTRAIHQLWLTAVGTPSPILQGDP